MEGMAADQGNANAESGPALFIVSQLFHNTGMALFVLGCLGTLAWQIYYLCYDTLKEMIMRRVMVRLTVTNRDEAFLWIMTWLGDHGYTKNATNVMMLNPRMAYYHRYGDDGDESEDEEEEEGETGSTRSFSFIPAEGTHFFRFQHRWCWFTFTKHSNTSQLSSNVSESLHIQFLGAKQSILLDLLRVTRRHHKEKSNKRTSILKPDQWCESWDSSVSKTKRPAETVILKDNLLEDIRDDIVDFLRSKKWYNARGIPYRRGYLLYGPPGTGKTSCVSAIAGELNMSVCVLNLSSRNLSDDTINDLINSAPRRSIILVEDVDSAFKRGKKSSEGKEGGESKDKEDGEENKEGGNGSDESNTDNRVTFSGLLNALDGCTAQEGRIFVLSTNHRERLQESLCRPGRVDFEIEIGYADEGQVRRLLRNFYPLDENDGDGDDSYCKRERVIDQFVEGVKEIMGSFTTAEVQGHCMYHKRSIEKMAARVDDFITKIKKRIERHPLTTVDSSAIVKS